MVKSFLDANVIANWMLLDATISLEPKQKQDLFKRLSKQVPSYRLLERVNVERGLHGTLITSRVALAEIISVLFEQALQKKMYDQGIPKYWERERHSERLSESERGDIMTQVAHFGEVFYESGKIGYVDDKYAFWDVTPLVLVHRIDEYDALLISTAIQENCKYFITEDKRLRKALTGFPNIKTTSAQNYLTNIIREA